MDHAERIMEDRTARADALTSRGWNDPAAMRAACAGAGRTLAGAARKAEPCRDADLPQVASSCL
jgi:hypothetical protein